MSVTFTTSPFVRAHGRQPKGRGSWYFQQATSHTAFDAELVGPSRAFHGTLTEAKAAARKVFPAGSIVAVLS